MRLLREPIKLWPRDGKGDPVVLSPGSPINSLAVLADERLPSRLQNDAMDIWPGA
jgi:hypothetical protein